MQTLQIKKRDDTGKEITVAVRVLRIFPDASGKQLFLHDNGIYGYKDGTPIQAASELDIIGNLRQRQVAKRWWQNTGQKLSEAYYAKVAEAEQAKLSDFQALDEVDNTELDQAFYRRRPKDGKKTDWEPAFAWMEKFSARPDWWGQAESITLSGFVYEMVAVTEEITSKEL